MKLFQRLSKQIENWQKPAEDSEPKEKSRRRVLLTRAGQSSEREKKIVSATLMGAAAFGIASALVIVVNGILPNILSSSSYQPSAPALGYSLPDASRISQRKSSSKSDHCNGPDASALDCLLKPEARPTNQCQIGGNELSAADMEVARIAWKYFENNYNESTGLVNSVHAYPSTTMSRYITPTVWKWSTMATIRLKVESGYQC